MCSQALQEHYATQHVCVFFQWAARESQLGKGESTTNRLVSTSQPDQPDDPRSQSTHQPARHRALPTEALCRHRATSPLRKRVVSHGASLTARAAAAAAPCKAALCGGEHVQQALQIYLLSLDCEF